MSNLSISIVEVGADVVATVSGAIDLSGLTVDVTQAVVDGINGGGGGELKFSNSTLTRYNGMSSGVAQGAFGSNTLTPGDTLSINNEFAFLSLTTATPILLVDAGYTSNTAISGTLTFLSKSLFTMGLTAGSYSWDWNGGLNTLSLQVGPGPTSTPTPTQTQTPTNTPTNAGITPTPTNTTTNTPTKTSTPTNTPTKTSTPTNTVTPTKTSTPTNTATNTPTPSNTPGVCKTYQLNGGNNGSSFVFTDCDGFSSTVSVGIGLSIQRCAVFVTLISGNGSVVTLGSCPLPSATPTPTPSITPSNTVTPSVTPSNTATKTPTPTKTPTNTPTNTSSPTPTKTSTPTNTPSITPSNSSTNTPTPTKTPTTTPTNSVTPTKTATNTPTPTKTPTNTPTSTVTPTKTSTPTPTPTPFGVFDVDSVYEYGTGQTGSFSGGTWQSPPFPLEPPHPSDWVPYGADGERQGVVVDLSAIQIGGFNGLNN